MVNHNFGGSLPTSLPFAPSSYGPWMLGPVRQGKREVHAARGVADEVKRVGSLAAMLKRVLIDDAEPPAVEAGPAREGSARQVKHYGSSVQANLGTPLDAEVEEQSPGDQ